MKKDEKILQGDIWFIRLDPAEGSEIRKTRPCLILSRSKINAKLNTVTVIPFSSGKTDKSILLINVLASKKNGLKNDSHLVIPQIRSVAKHRFIKKIGLLESNIVPFIRRSLRLYFYE